MTLEGWIFMVGLRVFDVGALIVWLVWFFRLRDEDDDSADGDDRRDGGSGTPQPPDAPPSGPPELVLPKPDAEPWPNRRRGHEGDRAPATQPARRVPAHRPQRAPART